ncbi:hypothetical protein [Aquifex sp.]
MEERIKFLTELLKLLWITIIALTGGIVGLLWKPDKNILNVSLIISGTVLDATLVIMTLKVLLSIRSLIQKIDTFKKEEEQI